MPGASTISSVLPNCHIPEGMLLAYDPQSAWGAAANAEPISTTRIAPTLLELQGVRPPSYMDRPIEQFARPELELA